jgi:streptogramin lyase
MVMLEPLEERALFAVGIAEFVIPPHPTGIPNAITRGPDGNVWIAQTLDQTLASQIDRINPDGTLTAFIAQAPAQILRITPGRDGNLWFTDQFGKIGRITTSGVITEFSAGLPSQSFPFGITAGPDGNLWFTFIVSNAGFMIGRITPAGTITTFPVNPHSHYAGGITAGPGGNLWFLEGDVHFGAIGRITPSGVVTEFPVPASRLLDIAAGPDGNLWFTDNGRNTIGRITPSGTIREFTLDQHFTDEYVGITAGPDGNLWFTEEVANRVGRITPAGVISEFTVPTPRTAPHEITVGPDGNLWFTELLSPIGEPARIGRVILSTSGTPNQQFVTQVYLDLLGRLPEASGVAAWSAALKAGVPQAQVASAIVNSAEYRFDQVNRLYNYLLTRRVDNQGLQTALAFLAAGGTVEQLAASLVASPEAQHLATTNLGFLTGLYLQALHRLPDASGLATFTKALDAGVSRQQVAAAIFGSQEYQNDLIASFYQQFLHRTAQPAEVGAWVNALENGTRDEEVIVSFLASDEYFATAQH